MLTQNVTHFTLTFSKRLTDCTVECDSSRQSNPAITYNMPYIYIATHTHMAAFEEYAFSVMCSVLLFNFQ